MLHLKQNPENLITTKKIKKSRKSFPVSKPSFLNKLPNLVISQLDPIKSPFFLNFFHYPSSIKSNILRIHRKPEVSDLDLLVKDLAFTHEFIDLSEMRQLVLDQEKLISSTMSPSSQTEEKSIERKPIESFFEESSLTSQEKITMNSSNNSKKTDLMVKVKEESEQDLSKTSLKKENSFYESSISTTPTKKGSPLFNEKKNLLLSSRIENILTDNYEMMVKKFDEESLNLESLEEEEENEGKMFCEGMWEDHENKAEKEAYFFKGLEMDRSLFANDKDFFNFI